MGVTLGQSLIKSNHKIFWASENRSQETKDRALQFGFEDLCDTKSLLEKCDLVFVIATQGGPTDIANMIIDNNYSGIVCDANNLYGKESEIFFYDLYASAKIRYVEASLFSYPYDISYGRILEHTIYLSGEYAGIVAGLFTDDYWDVRLNVQSAKEIKRDRVIQEKILRGETLSP